MKISDLNLLPHKILLKKCVSDFGEIVTTDAIAEWCNWAVIQDVGECTTIGADSIGSFMNLPDTTFRGYEVFIAEDEYGDNEKFVILDERKIEADVLGRIVPMLLEA